MPRKRTFAALRRRTSSFASEKEVDTQSENEDVQRCVEAAHAKHARPAV